MERPKFLVLYYFICLIGLVLAQYANNTAKYTEVISEQTAKLIGQIQSTPDVNLYFNPNSQYNTTNYYVFDFPIITDYIIGMILDPCRSNSYNCCINVFGSPEYPALLNPDLEAERVYKYIVIAGPTAVAKNYYIVDEYGNSIATSAQRSPDDYQLWNGTCIADSIPYDYCAGRNFAYEASPIRPACFDYNNSIDVLAGCYDAQGNYNSQCLTVAYTSNTFIPQCKISGRLVGNYTENCGTWLEIHLAHGTLYQAETDIIA